MAIPLNFYIDVSGQPTQEINIGIISINSSKMSLFLKEFKKIHPEFLREKQKSTRFKENKIKSLVNYFNGQKIHMYRVNFKSSYWAKLKPIRDRRKYWKERVYAALYFYGLKNLSKKSGTYQVIVCQENYLDIEKVKHYLKKIGAANGYDFQVSSSYASQSEMIKVSDIVAASHKISSNYLKNLELYYSNSPSLAEIKYYMNVL